MDKNPLTKDSDYVNKIISNLPGLKYLDYLYIDPITRKNIPDDGGGELISDITEETKEAEKKQEEEEERKKWQENNIDALYYYENKLLESSEI